MGADDRDHGNRIDRRAGHGSMRPSGIAWEPAFWTPLTPEGHAWRVGGACLSCGESTGGIESFILLGPAGGVFMHMNCLAAIAHHFWEWFEAEIQE
jgi:hypothetical protein